MTDTPPIKIESELDELWEILKDAHTNFWGEYTGLQAVSFAQDIDAFTRAYEAAVRRIVTHDSISVIQNPAEALEMISRDGVDLRLHHLSCAADTGFTINSALCIHYRIDEQRHALAIPGVNYIATAETLAEAEAWA